MKFTVLWTPDAERKLATIWTESARRVAVTSAAREIDQILLHDPEDEGESRGEGRRILLLPPLGVLFRVSRADRVVHVLTTWSYEPRAGHDPAI